MQWLLRIHFMMPKPDNLHHNMLSQACHVPLIGRTCMWRKLIMRYRNNKLMLGLTFRESMEFSKQYLQRNVHTRPLLLWFCLHFCFCFCTRLVPKASMNYIPALVQIVVWRRLGDKPTSEPRTVWLPTHICVTRPRWVNAIFSSHSASSRMTLPADPLRTSSHWPLLSLLDEMLRDKVHIAT